MEKLHVNLSEEEFSRGRKILLWSFSALFFTAGVYVLITNLLLGHKNIPIFIALITFGISLFVMTITVFSSITGKNLFFHVDEEIIEFRFGVIRPKTHTFKWEDITSLTMPPKQKKTVLMLRDGTSFSINLNWLQNNKASLIRKYLYQTAKEKEINVVRSPILHK
jgi:hypothetical protein